MSVFSLSRICMPFICRTNGGIHRHSVSFSPPHNSSICFVMYILYVFIFVYNIHICTHTTGSICCRKQTQDLCAIRYLSNIDIFQFVTQNSTCTRQNTLYFIILELIPMYTLVSEVHLCIKFTFIEELSSKPV